MNKDIRQLDPGQYWVLDNLPWDDGDRPGWRIYYWTGQYWMNPKGNEIRFVADRFVAIDDTPLTRDTSDIAQYLPVFEKIHKWIAELPGTEERKIQVQINPRGINVIINKDQTPRFYGQVKTFEELQTIWNCI
jgi:hypothetical protein